MLLGDRKDENILNGVLGEWHEFRVIGGRNYLF
jgi:hypothetical protein